MAHRGARLFIPVLAVTLGLAALFVIHQPSRDKNYEEVDALHVEKEAVLDTPCNCNNEKLAYKAAEAAIAALATKMDSAHLHKPQMRMVAPSEYGDVPITFDQWNDCPKQTMLDQYRNPCWKEGESLNCAPRLYFLGLRKCGSYDVKRWFATYGGEVLVWTADYGIMAHPNQCPNEFLKTAGTSDEPTANPAQLKGDKWVRNNTIMMISPGGALGHHVVSFDKSAGMVVRTSLDIIKMAEVTESRYIMNLREPASRTISQIFEWRELGWMKDLPDEKFNSELIHEIMMRQVLRVNQCLRDYGPRACFYLGSGRDRQENDLLLWSLYPEIVQRVLDLFPQDNVIFVKLEEFSVDPVGTMHKVFKLFGLEYHERQDPEEVKHKGIYKAAILPETMELLKAFYKPFNERLATMLRDDKWLWE